MVLLRNTADHVRCVLLVLNEGSGHQSHPIINHILEKDEALRISTRTDGVRTIAKFEMLETELVRRGRT